MENGWRRIWRRVRYKGKLDGGVWVRSSGFVGMGEEFLVGRDRQPN